MGQKTATVDDLIARSPEPETTALRYEQLRSEPDLCERIDRLPAEGLADLITVIGISNFLFQYLCSHGDFIDDFRQSASEQEIAGEPIADFSDLRRYKYRELLRLSRVDLGADDAQYPDVLTGLTKLAERVLGRSLQFITDEYSDLPLCVFGLGKLGAAELNFSSDIDLIFVTQNREDFASDPDNYQKHVVDSIRRLSRTLEEKTAHGFLYRVDLKLRPWGRSGPLAMSVDETEQYYEGTSESWERFAWLRARIVAGSEVIGEDLLQRLQPFIFSRTLSASDLDRFLQIKSDMASQRRRAGTWNVKLGEGGIRDIEFFVQMLQLVNGATHEPLRTTNTRRALHALTEGGFLDAGEADAIERSYLFLRRLENRLQMIDERQVHDLPDDKAHRRMLARSLGFDDVQGDALTDFEDALMEHQAMARNCFERILPDE